MSGDDREEVIHIVKELRTLVVETAPYVSPGSLLMQFDKKCQELGIDVVEELGAAAVGSHSQAKAT